MSVIIDTIKKSFRFILNLLLIVTKFLFYILKKRKLFPNLEHLVLPILSDTNCNLNIQHQIWLEKHQKITKESRPP